MRRKSSIGSNGLSVPQLSLVQLIVLLEQVGSIGGVYFRVEIGWGRRKCISYRSRTISKIRKSSFRFCRGPVSS